MGRRPRSRQRQNDSAAGGRRWHERDQWAATTRRGRPGRRRSGRGLPWAVGALHEGSRTVRGWPRRRRRAGRRRAPGAGT
ncbi:hypothetical protein QJS66_22505 [Kocuria rhizophila]|nr:hypothetical protein QJS66_22505 [Kocuria rhizophila]